MPSNPNVTLALEQMATARAAFESAVAATVEDVRRFLEEQRSRVEGHVERASAELGVFGTRHIDAARFGALFQRGPRLSSTAMDTIEHALDTLLEMQRLGPSLFTCRVPAGHGLVETVTEALARSGRAFGAARVAHAVRSARYRMAEHARSLGAFPFSKWNRTERLMAPPLIVEVRGEDLRSSALAELLDGRQKIVLLVDGPCSPVPLVRVISPTLFVAQVEAPDQLGDLARYDGAGIAAVVPSSAALFTHAPSTGRASWERVTIARMPDARPRRSVAGLSAAQQAEEIAALASLAVAPMTTSEPPSGATSEPNRVDQLAAWLLTQADLAGIE